MIVWYLQASIDENPLRKVLREGLETRDAGVYKGEVGKIPKLSRKSSSLDLMAEAVQTKLAVPSIGLQTVFSAGLFSKVSGVLCAGSFLLVSCSLQMVPYAHGFVSPIHQQVNFLTEDSLPKIIVPSCLHLRLKA